MSKLERITVTMPAEMAARLRAAVERGEYATTSEVVREALRDWGEERERTEAENLAIRKLLDEARQSPSLPANEVFARVRQRVADVVAEATAPGK
ncbi:type II toxin-antitoxin system ParD family antitoxin [Alteriqipengyuania sp. NZ-12B]|uniref:Type II toxin-antitoxin system ParD family antitoxin n=1 Tax=Alteriqipengyuania abyssalis TaxID=2860200 RepID=A0ABS7PDW8_9SPHN|nr:type II toxin-antitoxin system ParD family antitoxin [Alteriqipengyuania abyssalis]MBY8337278.1 type II toxin-antitoxin system ParD family antitoxin [Alteriqipengyuania abyssalis]